MTLICRVCVFPQLLSLLSFALLCVKSKLFVTIVITQTQSQLAGSAAGSDRGQQNL